MKKLLMMFFLFAFCVQFNLSAANGEYHLIIEGFDWGPAASKVILPLSQNAKIADAENYKVTVSRKTDIGEIPASLTSGSREVMHAFVSDEKGLPMEEGKHITLILAVAPYKPLSSPIQYFRGTGNVWVVYKLSISDTESGMVWNEESGRSIPILDDFDLKGKFTHKDITMSYAAFKPETGTSKVPLLIWLHGGGEGGTDPSIAAIGNKAINYASEEIQSVFEGAYVLVPQAPTFWMNSVKGGYTRGETNDMYNEGLMALIKDYVNKHPEIDTKRIYVGGCSNGGYMSLKLILNHPQYFAASFISSLAYSSEFITDKQIISIKNVPIWFVQSKDDNTTKPDDTVVPVYKRLKAAGAKNVHFSFYDHVIDITGQYGGESYYYNGHWSWVYLHANESHLDFDGGPVKVNGMPVNIMQWLSAQKVE
jgi:poly(3-hydroxybutyrate) depolymerase